MSGETTTAHARRLREGWYDRFAPSTAKGLDVGATPDPIHPESESWTRWNTIDGDATFLSSVASDQFETVYGSHVMEDLERPIEGLINWFRVLKLGGYLIVCVPHRDLYERRKELPSLFNGAHRWFYLPDREEDPCTRSLHKDFRAALPEAQFIHIRVLDEGWKPIPPEYHAQPEYSIELICRKV